MGSLGYVVVVLLVIMAALFLMLSFFVRKVRNLENKLEEILSAKRSKEVLHGKAWEEFAPFMKNYPFDPRNFKFIGMPIDGLSFEEKEIVVVEFKTGESKLSEKQKQIRKLVEEKKVRWMEVRG